MHKYALIVVLALTCTFPGCGGGSSSSSSSTTTTISKVTVTPTTPSVVVGSTQQFYAAATDTNNNSVGAAFSWTSSSTSVATVNSSGVAEGVSAGTAQITATAAGVTSAPVTLTVTAKVASISISPMSSSINVGGTQQYTATALDSSGKPVSGVSISWFCSFAGVATIDNNGLVTGVAPGTVTIVASAGSITSQPAALTVTP